MQVKAGDIVTLLDIPDWLIHDLPAEEQEEIKSYVGQSLAVQKIDENGYAWLGAGRTTETSELARYSGHSFCVPPEYLSKL